MPTTVLIIDDHQLFNDGLSLILKESAFFQVIGQVYDSRQAVYQCQTLNPKLVLVDFNMPHLDGLGVVNALKAQGFKGKIVVISMYADAKEIAIFKQLGIDGYLPKTTPASELIKVLKKIMANERIYESLNLQKKRSIKEVSEYKLTKREIDILRALKKGITTEQVAHELNLSYYTVETHRKNINQKLNLKSKIEFYDFLRNFERED
ncbi:response regulator transcription factor [Runella sp. MFBS21]|uniref:response regulator n=1 Tax=Runella sp. MFBS21 TaxID=3034018 RepID=UPI0023F8A73D|nr:response regulator transcription factor [Runella sp. MFBS21]MDF7819205.1 response regulator transcription factor [Runella sp. MFBS21]